MFLFAAAAMALSCSRMEEPVVRRVLIEKCVVLAPKDHDREASGWTRWCERHLPGVIWLEPTRAAEAVQTCLASDLLLVVPGSVPVSPEMDRALGDYLLAGGRLLNLGTRHVLEATDGTEVREALGLHLPLMSVTTTAVRVRGVEGLVSFSARALTGTQPGPLGAGGDQAGEMRWIPMVEVVEGDGVPTSWPGAIWLTPQAHGRYAVAGWLGMNLTRDDTKGLLPMMNAVLEDMTRDIYVQRFGVPHFSMAAKSPHTATARLIDRRADLTPVRLVVEWLNERGQEVRRHVSPPLDALTGQTTMNIGLAPSPPANPERYTLRFVVRDRNDQRTFDVAEQPVKVFPAETSRAGIDPITVNAGQLMQGRRPVFMLGVNYWPRTGVPMMRENRHWLHAGNFNPATIESDLDLMESVGLNAVAFEYTDIGQAPQVRYMLDEARRRSMWVSLYVPALNPMDLRIEEARAMLEAIDLAAWPEVFALEVARGFTVLPRVERRRLDAAWSDWVEEHFNSIDEAELKLGLSLWRERGRLAGPPDPEVKRGPHQDRAVALYYCFLRDYVSRRLGFVRRWKQAAGYSALITARSAYGWPGDPPSDALDMLDISAGVLHLDILYPDAWAVHPLRSMPGDGDVLAAYVRGAGAGKPVVWSSFGQSVGQKPDASSYQRQKEVYAHYLNEFIRHESSGAFAWWFPPGVAGPVREDWGLVHPHGAWRPVEESFRAARLQIRQLRVQPRPVVRKPGPQLMSASHLAEQQRDRTGLFSPEAISAGVTEWMPPGVGTDCRHVLDPRFRAIWSEIDAFSLLNAEWSGVVSGDSVLVREPGDPVRIYTGRTLKAELLNSGTVHWLGGGERTSGSVWVRISQPGSQDEWVAIGSTDRGARKTIEWQAREPGIWDIQPFLMGYGKFGERLRVDVSSPPRLF
jgi:hypothetical protein